MIRVWLEEGQPLRRGRGFKAVAPALHLARRESASGPVQLATRAPVSPPHGTGASSLPTPAETLRSPQSGADGSSGGKGLRRAPVLLALLALICFGVALLFPGWGTFMLGVLGVVVFVVIAIYA